MLSIFRGNDTPILSIDKIIKLSGRIGLMDFAIVKEILYIRAPFEQKAGRKTSANRKNKEYNPFIFDVQFRLWMNTNNNATWQKI